MRFPQFCARRAVQTVCLARDGVNRGQHMRFFLHVDEQDGLIRDHEGLEFPSLEKAVAETFFGIRDIAMECFRSGEELTLKAIAIADETGLVITRVTLRDALQGLLPDFC